MLLTVWGDDKSVLLWGRTAFATGTLMSGSFAIFSIIFRHEKFQPGKLYIYLITLFSIIFVIISIIPSSIRQVVFEVGKMNPYYGMTIYIWMLYPSFCWLLIFYNLGYKWRKGNGIEKLRIQYMFFGIVLTTSSLAITSIFIPIIFRNVRIAGFGPCFIMIMIGCIAYAIAKHRLMDIKVLIRKSIFYSVLFASASLIVALLVIGIPQAFPNIGRTQYAIVLILCIIFVVFVSKPFSQYVIELVNTFVYKDQSFYRKALANFTQIAIKTLDLDKLLSLMFHTIVETMKVDRASLWCLSSRADEYTPILLFGLKQNEVSNSISSGSKVVSYLKKADEPIIKEEIQKNLSLADFDEIENEFNNLKSEISVPLFLEDQLSYIINLGNKSSGRIYYSADIEFLKSIADQSSILIQNALLHQQIVRTEKLISLGKLSAELAHEIKNPLLTIKTCFQLLLEHQCEEEIDKDFLTLALSETDKIDRRIRQLLSFVRPSPPNFAWCNINQVLDSTIQALKNIMSTRNIQFIDLRSSDVTEIYADKEQLEQAFLNIGLNALEAMENGGKLTIETIMQTNGETNAEGEFVVVKISDTGKGISKIDMESIFEPFYTKKSSGTGLGLAIVRNIIKEHKGHIHVESHEGVGTSFMIKFPVTDQNLANFQIRSDFISDDYLKDYK
ncbi:MAG: GAF domain-containing sensor histidine kinase [bacterium]